MNRPLLIVADMGLEIPIPPINITRQKDVAIPVRERATLNQEIKYSEPSKFNITRLDDGNYELDKYEYLREALAFCYKYPSIINQTIDYCNIDISNAKIISCTTNSSYEGTILGLELRI